jgi:hypothetical protein
MENTIYNKDTEKEYLEIIQRNTNMRVYKKNDDDVIIEIEYFFEKTDIHLNQSSLKDLIKYLVKNLI